MIKDAFSWRCRPDQKRRRTVIAETFRSPVAILSPFLLLLLLLLFALSSQLLLLPCPSMPRALGDSCRLSPGCVIWTLGCMSQLFNVEIRTMCYYHHPSRCVSVRRMVEGGLGERGRGDRGVRSIWHTCVN